MVRMEWTNIEYKNHLYVAPISYKDIPDRRAIELFLRDFLYDEDERRQAVNKDRIYHGARTSCISYYQEPEFIEKNSSVYDLFYENLIEKIMKYYGVIESVGESIYEQNLFTMEDLIMIRFHDGVTEEYMRFKGESVHEYIATHTNHITEMAEDIYDKMMEYIICDEKTKITNDNKELDRLKII